MFAVGVALLPVLTFAADTGSTVGTILFKIQNIFGIVVPVIMTLALLYFFWGLAHYVLGAGDEEKRKEGRSMMIYGVIALFVMAAVWGLVQVLANTFDIQTGGVHPDLPQIPNVGPNI